MSKLDVRSTSPNFAVSDQASKVSSQIVRVTKAVVAGGDQAIDWAEQARRRKGAEPSVADARLEALLGAISSRLGSPRFVRQTEAATTLLNQLNSAQIEAARGDSTIFVGVAALGKIERSLAALKKLGHVEGLPNLDTLIPESYLGALRERWYPAAREQIFDLLLDAVGRGINIEAIRGLTELAKAGDATISAEASRALEPMLTQMLERTGALEVAELLALFPPQLAENQLKLVGMLDKAESPALQDALATVVGKMTPQPEVQSALRMEKWTDRAPEVTASIILARSHFTTADIRAAIAHRDPRIQAAGLEAFARNGHDRHLNLQIEELLGRSTDPGSKDPIHPLVKAAAVRAVPAMMKDAAAMPGNWETIGYLLRSVESVLAPFSTLNKADPDPMVRQAALETLLAVCTDNKRLSISHTMLRAVEDPYLGGQAIDAIRRIAYPDTAFMEALGQKLEEVRARGPSPQNDWLRLELTKLYDLRGLNNSRVGPRGPMLTALFDQSRQIQQVAAQKLAADHHWWPDADLKALKETVIRAAGAPAETKLVLAKLITAGAKEFEETYGREQNPFPEIAALLTKVAKSPAVTAALAQVAAPG